MRKGDFARYILSERWKKWGKPDFQAIPWPKADSIGRRDQNGKFIRQRGRMILVAAISAATKDELTANSAATPPPVAAKSAVNEPISPPPVAAKSAVLLSSPVLDPDLQGGRIKKKDVDHEEVARGRDDAQPSIPKLKLSDLRKQVADILDRKLPKGHIRNDSYATSVLWDVKKGKLDADEIRRQFKGYFTGSIINEMFTLIGTNVPKVKTTIVKPKVVFSRRATPEEIASVAAWT
jgi:hypothetical protein